jgi:DNA-binding NarL/FixJ family response regulator
VGIDLNVPATRLLVVAEPKMLNALANGLRVGGRFEIATAQFSEPAALEPLTAQAEVVALFYGSKQFPLVESIQALSQGIRARGGQLIAVLQKDQAQQRDECLHAGASDLLFMPMPKDQFVARLFDAASRAFAETEGHPAQVTVLRKGSAPRTHQIDAKVVLSGVVASGGPKLDAGETVQLSWKGAQEFSRWGVVLQSGDAGLRVRIVGASADEEAQLKAWIAGLPIPQPSAPPQTLISAHAVPPTILDTPSFPPGHAGAHASKPEAPPIPATVVEVPAIATGTIITPPPSARADTAPLRDVQATLVDMKAVPPTLLEVQSFGADATTTAPAPVASAIASKSSPGTITAGPPPGFAARPPIRPQSVRGGGSTMPGRPRSIDANGVTGEDASVSGTTDPAMARKNSDPGIAPRPATSATNPGLTRPTAGSNPVRGGLITPPRMLPVVPKASAGSNPGTTPAPGTSAAAEVPKISDPGLAKAPAASGVPAPAPAAVSTPASNPIAAVTSSPALAPVNAATLSSSLFDDPPTGDGTAAPAPQEAPQDLAPLASWPTPLDHAVVRSLLGVILRDKILPEDVPAEPGAAVRKVVGAMPSIDREALGNVGPDSHLHEALSARVQLVHASSDGNKLVNEGEGALVDDASFTALIQAADTAIKRLQSEADGAITKGEVERLQQVTAASAALSREMLAFKETADRLRGLAAAPRMGASALDPSVAIDRRKPPSVRIQRDKDKEETRAEHRKLQLSDFAGLEVTPATSKQRRNLIIAGVILAVTLGNTLFFAMPHSREADTPMVEQAGSGVLGIAVSDRAAVVSVAQTWVSAYDRKSRLRSLCDSLDARGVRRAVILAENVGIIGQVEVQACQAIGLPAPKPPPPELGNVPH